MADEFQYTGPGYSHAKEKSPKVLGAQHFFCASLPDSIHIAK